MKKLMLRLLVVFTGAVLSYFGWQLFFSGTDIRLVNLRTIGGYCFYGGCWSNLSINDTGEWTYEDGAGSKGSGKLSAEDKRKFRDLLRNTKLSSLLQNKFTGECPANSDGPEHIYTFQPSGIVIDDCKILFDTDDLAQFLVNLQYEAYSSSKAN